MRAVHEVYADLAHPVERHLPKVDVASSSLVIRSSGSVPPQKPSLHSVGTVVFLGDENNEEYEKVIQ